MVSRRVRRRRRQFTTVGVLLVLLLIYFAFFSGGGSKPPPPEAVHKAHDTVDVKPFPKHSPLNPDWTGDGKQVTFGFGGDVHFAGAVGNNLAQNPATALGATIPQLFTGTQLRMVNLETAVTDGTCPEPQNKPYIFDAPASAITALKSAQITLVTEANDHGEDCGPQGLSQNLSIAAQAGYPIIGIGNNAAQAFTPYRVTIDGQRIAIIAATQVIADNLVPTWTATATTAGVASAIDPTELVREVQQVRRSADTVIVYVHWGTETQSCPNPQQEPLAEQLVKAGADVVIGSDAHVLSGGGYLGSRVRGLRARQLRLLRRRAARDVERVAHRHRRRPARRECHVPACDDRGRAAPAAHRRPRCLRAGELDVGPCLHESLRRRSPERRHHAHRDSSIRGAHSPAVRHDDDCSGLGDKQLHHDDDPQDHDHQREEQRRPPGGATSTTGRTTSTTATTSPPPTTTSSTDNAGG